MFMKGMNTKVFIPTNLSEFYNKTSFYRISIIFSAITACFSVLPLSDVLISTDKITVKVSVTNMAWGTRN